MNWLVSAFSGPSPQTLPTPTLDLGLCDAECTLPGRKSKGKEYLGKCLAASTHPNKIRLEMAWTNESQLESSFFGEATDNIPNHQVKKKAVPHLEWQTFDTQRPPHTANKCFNMIYVIIYNNIIYIIYTMFLCGKLVSSWIQHFHACSYVHGPESSLNQPEARDQSWQYVWPQLVKNAPLKKCLLRYPLATYRSRGKLPALLGKIVIISLQIIYKRTMLC